MLCRVFQKRKDSEQDNGSASSPPYSGPSPDVTLPEQPYCFPGYQTGLSDVGLTPPQEDPFLNPAIWQYNSALDHHQYPQEVSSSPMMMGLGSFYDTSCFEDTAAANMAGMGFPQGWMG